MAHPQAPGGVAPRTPSKTGIIWAIVIFAVTAVLGVVLIVVGVLVARSAIDDFAGVDAGDTRTVQLNNGTYDVYAGETTGRPSRVATMGIRITDPSGDDVSFISGDRTTTTFESGNDYFEKVGSFDVSSSGPHEPGAYEIEATGPDGTTARVGQMPFLRIGLLIGGGIAVGTLGFIVAGIVLIVALVRRSRVKKVNRLAAWGPPGAPPGPYGYGQPPYGQPSPGAPVAGYGGPGQGQTAPGTPPPPMPPPGPPPGPPPSPPAPPASSPPSSPPPSIPPPPG